MGSPPAGSFRDVFLKNNPCNQQAASHFFHCPASWSGKRLCRWIFFERHFPWQIGIAWAGIHQSFSHGSISASTAKARWFSVRPVQATNPTAKTAHYCLTSYSDCKHYWALTAISVTQATCCSAERSDFLLWTRNFVFLTSSLFYFKGTALCWNPGPLKWFK